MKTKVIFRKWRDTGDVLALFPQDPGTNDPYTCSSYMHVGQHGSADPQHVIAQTWPAMPDEYADLVTELTRIGYDLEIGKRVTAADLEVRKHQLLST